MAEPQHNDQVFIRKLTDIILENLGNENFGVNQLADAFGMSPYRLNRKLNEIKNETINQFIREVRLLKALEILKNEPYTASEVAFKVGFNSTTYFTKSFHEFFGYPPGKVKKGNIENQSKSNLTHDSSNFGHNMTAIFRLSPIVIRILVSFILLVIIAFSIYPRIFKVNSLENLLSSNDKISIAVMPFQNLTNDTIWNIWQYAIQESLISSLSNIKDLIVRQQGTVNGLLQINGLTEHAAISPRIGDKISQKLDASLFINGYIKEGGSIINIEAQLIDTKTKEVFKSFDVNGYFKEENIFKIIDTLSKQVRNFLLISKLIKENPEYGRYPLSTKSPEALRYTIYGDKAASILDNSTAISWYFKALAADSNYFDPMIGLSSVYGREGNIEEDLNWVLKYYNKKDSWSLVDQLYASWAYALSFESRDEAIKYLKQIKQIDDQSNASYLLGLIYNELNQFDKAIIELEKNMEICRRWGKDHMKNNSAYTELGYAYHKTGQYKKEKNLYKLAEKYIPEDGPLTSRQAILAFTENDSVAANLYIKKLISLHKRRYSSPEAHIDRRLAELYAGAGNLDKAEEYYRKSLSLEPDNPLRMNVLAQFLIENNRKLGEVQGLIDKAIQLAANKYDYSSYTDTKGWGLYKQGKYNEALEVLQKTWDSAPYKIYSIKSHLDEVKKVVAGLK